MKNYSTFAATQTKSFLLFSMGSGFFYGYLGAALSQDKRLSILSWLLLLRCNCSWSSWGKIAFLLLFTLIFHSMTKSNENYSTANNSTRIVTPTERNTVPIEAFNIEMDAKNKAYFFILSHGLLEQFSEFSKSYRSGNPHKDSVDYLLSKI